MALIGPRQVGKIALALALASTLPSLYLDLENPADRQKMADHPVHLSGTHMTSLVQ